MKREEVRAFVNQYCHLRDVQYAAYTDKGYDYAKKIIPPAANAEIDAMAELAKSENIAELVRLTMLFSGLMKRKFDELK